MNDINTGFPTPSDYFGVLWALSGIADGKVVEHGSTGTMAYNAINFRTLNRFDPKGILFTSGMDEEDVIMGREDKLIAAIRDVDQRYQPRLLSVVATAVTAVIGLDLAGIATEIEPQIQARLLTFTGGGFRGSYRDGIAEVLTTLAQKIVKAPRKSNPRRVNLLGVTINSFNHVSDVAEIRRLLGLFGIQVHTVLTQKTNVAEIETMSEAALNLVLDATGLKAAEILEKRFGIPYLTELPFGLEGTVEWLETVEEKLQMRFEKAIIAREIRQYGETMCVHSSFRQPFDRLRVGISGSDAYVRGLSQLIKKESAMDVKLAMIDESSAADETQCWLENLGIETVVRGKDHEVARQAIKQQDLHVLLGNAYELNQADQVPVRIHAAFPSYDYYNAFDGTPFVGFRGNAYLIQLLVNQVNQHPEVWEK